jgi:heme-degrading monooxygenase HmoA
MYPRVVQATIQPKRLAEFKNAVSNHDLPVIRTQPGFVGDLVMYSGNSFLSITFWQTEEAADRYTQEVFPRLAARSGPLASNILRAESYRLDNHTILEMRSGEVKKKVESVPVRQLAAAAAA